MSIIKKFKVTKEKMDSISKNNDSTRQLLKDIPTSSGAYDAKLALDAWFGRK